MSIADPRRDTRLPNEWYDLVNEVAIGLGIPPVTQDQDIVGGSDYDIILKQLGLNVRRLLHRGWWFNTSYNMLVEPDPIEDGFVKISNLLHMRPIRNLDYTEPPRVMVRQGSADFDEATVVPIDDEGSRFKQPFYADLIFSERENWLPEEATTFVAYQTQVKLAPIFGAPPLNEEMATAWHELLRAEADFGHTSNAFNNNPSIAHTTMRSR